jgi:hypothetical protein
VDMQLPYWHARRGRTGVAICVGSQVCGMRGSDNMVASEGETLRRRVVGHLMRLSRVAHLTPKVRFWHLTDIDADANHVRS